MDQLLKSELLYTQQLLANPSEENKIKLLNVKKEIIQNLNMTGGHVKKVCDEYYNECQEKLLNQYEYFSNLLEYLKDKEDVSNIEKMIDETIRQIIK